MSKAEVALGRGTTIPVIDLSGFTGEDSDTHAATAISIRHTYPIAYISCPCAFGGRFTPATISQPGVVSTML